MAQNKTSRKPPPVCKAILLCDEVVRDAETHKTSVIGIFDTFVVPGFPGSTSPCKLFLLLIDAIGAFEIMAEIHDLKDGNVIARSPSRTIGSPGKRTQGEQWLPVPALPVAHSGPYDLIVFADENEIDRVQFKVKTLGGIAHGRNQ